MTVTRMICPSCEGTGECTLFSGLGMGRVNCLWCKGERRLSADEAERYADNLYTIGVGGYIAGDHDYEDARRMEDKAARVFSLLQRTPTWRRA